MKTPYRPQRTVPIKPRKRYDGRMNQGDETCWTLIEDAAAGRLEGRERFAHDYAPVVQAYLRARWGAPQAAGHLDDATQEVFLECFKEGGALEKAESRRRGGFRAFLYGVTRNVARRYEGGRGKGKEVTLGSTLRESSKFADEDLERAFDRAWALSSVRQAVAQQRRRAEKSGERALRRVEILRLRFQESLPIREIAAKLDVPAAETHHEYATARREFEAALQEVVAFHLPGNREDVERECRQLLKLLEG